MQSTSAKFFTIHSLTAIVSELVISPIPFHLHFQPGKTEVKFDETPIHPYRPIQVPPAYAITKQIEKNSDRPPLLRKAQQDAFQFTLPSTPNQPSIAILLEDPPILWPSLHSKLFMFAPPLLVFSHIFFSSDVGTLAASCRYPDLLPPFFTPSTQAEISSQKCYFLDEGPKSASCFSTGGPTALRGGIMNSATSARWSLGK